MSELSSSQQFAALDQQGFDPMSIWIAMRDGWWIMAAAIILVLGVASVHLYQTAPIYRADAVLQIDRPAPPPGLEAISRLFTADAQPGAEAYQLRSRDIARVVVDRLGLNVTVEPRYFPMFGQAKARRYRGDSLGSPPFGALGHYIGFAHYAWGGEKIELGRFTVPDSANGDRFALVREGDTEYSVFDSEGHAVLKGTVGVYAEVPFGNGKFGIEVSQLRINPGVEVYITRRDPVNVAEILRKQVSANPSSRTAMGLLDVSYEHTSPTQARDILNAFIQAFVRQNIEYRSEQAAQMVGFIEAQLPDVKAEVKAAESAMNEFRLRQGAVSIESEGQSLLDQMVKIESELSLLNLQRAELILQLTPKHPSVRAVDARREELLRTRAAAESQLKVLPKAELELVQLKRSLDVSSEIYVSLLNRVQELRVVKAGEIGNVHIVDSPILPRAPVRPNPLLVRMLALLLGLVLGLSLIALRELLRRGVRDAHVIEARLSLPVLATVAFSQNERTLFGNTKSGAIKEPQLLVFKAPHDPATESIRGLRTSLQFSQFDAKNKVIALTGCSPEVGKSFISSNLAAAISQTGKRVVLIDADMRRGRLHTLVGAKRSPGLSNILAGSHTIADCMTAINEQLFLIPAGNVPPNPAELLQSSQFTSLLNTLGEQFDTVILDTPPVLAVTDASVIGSVVGSVYLVLRHGRHPIHEIEEAVRRLKMAGGAVRGVVMNAVTKSESGYGYAKYGYYRYDYTPIE